MDTLDKDITHSLFARYVNEVYEKILNIEAETNLERIILYTTEKLAPLFKEKLIEKSKLPVFIQVNNIVNANYNTIKETILKDIDEIEREIAGKELDEALSQIGVSDYKKGVAGLSEVIEHINARAVYKLFINPNCEFAPIYKDENGLIYLEEGEERRKSIDSFSEIVFSAMAQKAQIKCTDDERLKEHDCLLALVRFKV